MLFGVKKNLIYFIFQIINSNKTLNEFACFLLTGEEVSMYWIGALFYLQMEKYKSKDDLCKSRNVALNWPHKWYVVQTPRWQGSMFRSFTVNLNYSMYVCLKIQFPGWVWIWKRFMGRFEESGNKKECSKIRLGSGNLLYIFLPSLPGDFFKTSRR